MGESILGIIWRPPGKMDASINKNEMRCVKCYHISCYMKLFDNRTEFSFNHPSGWNLLSVKVFTLQVDSNTIRILLVEEFSKSATFVQLPQTSGTNRLKTFNILTLLWTLKGSFLFTVCIKLLYTWAAFATVSATNFLEISEWV